MVGPGHARLRSGAQNLSKGLSFTEPVGTLRAVRHMNFISILGQCSAATSQASPNSYNTLWEVWGIAPDGLLSSLADGPRNGPIPAASADIGAQATIAHVGDLNDD